jgi:hypothetical protein
MKSTLRLAKQKNDFAKRSESKRKPLQISQRQVQSSQSIEIYYRYSEKGFGFAAKISPFGGVKRLKPQLRFEIII